MDRSLAEVADIIATALLPESDDAVAARLRARVAALTAKYPLHPHLADVPESVEPLRELEGVS